MTCPRCGAARTPELLECSSCGVIFARWKGEVERRPTRVAFTSEPVRQRNGLAAVVAGVVILVAILGVTWTRRHQAARRAAEAKYDPLEDANAQYRKEAAKRRSADAAAAAPLYAAERSKYARAHSLPPDVSMQRLNELLIPCAFFGQDVTVTMPKTFRSYDYAHVVEQYPALKAARDAGDVVLEPPLHVAEIVNVRLTPAGYGRTKARETAENIEINLGRRIVDSIQYVSTSDEEFRVDFTWTYSAPELARLALATPTRASASFKRQDGIWLFEHAWTSGPTGTSLCPRTR